MTDIRTQLFALGYLLTLAVGVFVVSAVEIPPMARSMVMGIPIAMLAGLTWSVAAASRTTVATALWLVFAGMATSMLIDWRTWEYLGVASLMAPLLAGRLATQTAGPVVVAVDEVRRAA